MATTETADIASSRCVIAPIGSSHSAYSDPSATNSWWRLSTPEPKSAPAEKTAPDPVMTTDRIDESASTSSSAAISDLLTGPVRALRLP